MENIQFLALAGKATEVLMKNTTEAIFKKVEAAKADHDKEKTVRKLEEIINELIKERNELNMIINEYDELLSMQKISEKDVNYIAENIVPIFSRFFESDFIKKDESINSDDMNQLLEVLKPLLSIETFTILQLLGFNFKEAIGIPLTKIVNRSIDKADQTEMNYKYAISNNRKEEELYRLLQTEEGRDIYKKLPQSRE